MVKKIKLKKEYEKKIIPKPPYNFNKTVRDPGHFPTPIEIWEPNKFWKTMRFKGKILGTKFENKGTIDNPKIKFSVYSTSKLSKKFIKDLIKDIKFRYCFDEDLSDFYNKVKSDSLFKHAYDRMKGAHIRALESLYEIAIISIVLQNATVKRTVQMMNSLLEKYAQKIKFNEKEMFLIWKPQKLAKISEKELRDLKVGYRAKMLIRISQDFIKQKINEYKLREMPIEKVEKKLLKLYGIGPASLDILLSVLRKKRKNITISPWEQKIYSKIFFNKKLVSADKILKEMKRRYGKQYQLASYLLFENLFWEHQKKSIPWLEKEIRM